jgi:hypothetical protein
VHEKPKLIERVVIGVVACAISVQVLVAELPRLLPYLVILAVIFIAIRLVLFHTQKW